MPDEITFTIGQAVPWRPSPCGIAQIAELLRTRVKICYPTKRGTIRFATLRAAELADRCRREPLLIDLRNPFNRGVVSRSKSFQAFPPRNIHAPAMRIAA